MNRFPINFFAVSLIGLILLLASGCGQTITPGAPSAVSNLTETQPIATSPTKGETLQMTPPLNTPAGPALQRLIEKAKSDLAGRLSISPTRINVVNATEVEWSDSSLGCPQPGMSYLQVITPGYQILLEAGGQQYEYHSNRDNLVVYCENSMPSISPKP